MADIDAGKIVDLPDYTIQSQTFEIRSLLSVDGIRYIFSGFVSNFAGFSVVAVTFVAMMGVGVAEHAGLMAALIRKLVKVAPRRIIAFAIIFGIGALITQQVGSLIQEIPRYQATLTDKAKMLKSVASGSGAIYLVDQTAVSGADAYGARFGVGGGVVDVVSGFIVTNSVAVTGATAVTHTDSRTERHKTSTSILGNL